MKLIGIILMYSFRISKIDDFVVVTTKMISLQSPRMALEEYGYDVGESSFKKGDITFSYYASFDRTVNINVLKGDVLLHQIRRAYVIHVLVTSEGIVLSTPDFKVTVNVD